MYSKTIDDIFKCLEELEAQGDLSVTAENQIQTLKFQLRFVRMLIKWSKDFRPVGLEDIRTWIIDIKKRLFQTTTKGSTAADLLEKRLSSLLQIMEHLMKQKPTTDCGEFEAWYGLNLADKNVVIDELVGECFDPLLEHLARCNDLNLLVFSNEQIEAFMEKLRSLRNFLAITGTELRKALTNLKSRPSLLHKTSEDLLSRIEVIIHNALYLSWHSWAKGNQKKMEELLSHLLVKINHIEPEIRMIYVQLLKASKVANSGALGIDIQALAAVDSLLDNLQKLLKDKDTGPITKLDIHQIDSLHQELSFVKYFLMDPHLKYTENEPQSFNSLLVQVEAMARAAVTHCICVGETKDHMVNEIDLLHSNLLKIVYLLKAEIRQMYLRIPKPSTLCFPQTPKLTFLDFFLQRLDELLKHRVDSITYVKNEIEILQSELGSLYFFVSDTINKSEPEEDETIARLIVDVAYEAELVIDLISASNLPSWYYMLWLFDIIEKIKMLRKDCTELCSKKTCEINMLNVVTDYIHGSPQAFTLAAEGEVIGFNDEAGKIIDRLTRGSEELEIVSIVGMPGLGKTTLAKKVYEHPSVSSYFHVRSWYCISQVYERRNLLASILGDVTELREEIQEMDSEDMVEVLYKSLKGRRYLIVIDDIWNIRPWNDLRLCFPDDSNGSRILFTTRIREVALQASHRSAPHDLRLFTDKESWELLQNKVFKQRSCPPGLHKIGKEIAKNCKGLPLSVVVIAGVLMRLEESEDNWREVSKSLGKQVFGDSSQCLDILELSYKHLPDHLKPCFLYLGAFPEDEEIPTWKLIRLWIAEGFVQNSKSESLENIAEGYLMDLIARSLVLVNHRKSNGGVKSCLVHDLLHEFSLNKAKHENFLHISREMVNPEQYRHCFYCKRDSLNGWRPHDPYVRSVFFFPTEKAVILLYNSRHVDLSVLPYILKLLRVLDLERIPLRKSKFPAEIELLVHLRYLAIQGRLHFVPSSVGKLWRLETLLVVGTNGKVQLPEILLEMAYLKHVYVSDEAAFVLPKTFQPEKCFESGGIENFSTLSLCSGDGRTEKIISRLRCLRKLKCIFLESWDNSRHCNKFPVLDSLSKLESLNVTYHGRVRVQHGCVFSFPSNLKKLTLSNFNLPWSEISNIGRLPQLEVLKLCSCAFDGQRWDVSEEEFCNLKVLKLESLNIVEWYASPDAFPCLQQLVLQRCKTLEEIPSSFGELATLRIIEAHWCSYSATKAVCKILEEQEDLGADGLKGLIQPPDWDSETAS